MTRHMGRIGLGRARSVARRVLSGLLPMLIVPIVTHTHMPKPHTRRACVLSSVLADSGKYGAQRSSFAI